MRTCHSQELIPLNYTITEGLPRDSLIGNIPADAKLHQNLGLDLNGLYYSFLPQKNPHLSLFFINEKTGLLKTNELIDRDSIPECENLLVCTMDIDVGVLSDDLDIVKVTITIEDINDNAPTFSDATYHLTVSESAEAGVAYVLPTARDPDAGENAIQHYRLITSGDKLSLQVMDNSDGTFDLRLVLNARLDREDVDSYSAVLVAEDNGMPSLSGSMQIDITVGDSNDNSPIFLNQSYEIAISEKFPVNGTITQVKAIDLDDGLNGQIVYSFDANTQRKSSSMFVINSVSGDIVLKSALDYEKQSVYKLVIAARDMGADSIPTHAKLTIQVRDVNDYAPKITVNAISSTHSAMIRENGNLGDFVAHVRVEDADSGPSGDVACILNDRHFQLLKIYDSIYKIRADAIFDRELKPSYAVTIECADHGNPPLQSRKDIVVQIGDENDHSPVFVQSKYNIEIAENNSLSMPLFRVNATDMDAGDNAKVLYSLEGDQANHFLKVDPHSGLVSTKNKFDYEVVHSFECIVVARDSAEPPKSSSASITINIRDINDEAPVFSENPFTFVTYENQPIGTEIGNIYATDPDSPPNNRVIYSLDPKRGYPDTFSIDPLSGRLALRQVLDREFQNRYDLVVITTNPVGQGPPGPSSSASVMIHVADMNDNAPMIIFPNHQNRSAQVPFRAPSGYVFSQVEAKDADYGPNAELEFNIEKGTGADLFIIDSLTGILMTKGDISRMNQDEYTLLITVKDKGIPQKTAMTELVVIVNKTLGVGYLPNKGLDTSGSGQNQTILITMSVVTVILVLILILAIVYVKRKQIDKEEEFHYKCKMDLSDHMPDSPGDQRSAHPQGLSPAHRSSSRSGVLRLNPTYGPVISGVGVSGGLDSSRETGEGESEEQDQCGPAPEAASHLNLRVSHFPYTFIAPVHRRTPFHKYPVCLSHYLYHLTQQ